MKRLPLALSFLFFLALSASLTYWLVQWTAPAPRYTRGVQAKFAHNASSASKGAVLDLF